MNINHNAPVQQTKELFINAAPEKVWKILSNINGWGMWLPEVKKIKVNGDVKPGTSFKWTNGGTGISSVLHTVKPNEFIGWTGKAAGTYAVHNWILVAQNGGTLLRTEESMQGFVAFLFKGMLNKMLVNGMSDWLTKIKDQAEKN
ncbi:polyketide cyclase/dehydrase/lipid transport protein [Chitinophaga niastensis]|uniref:Polyketide cyclase/dehydrase/lipid transport protein n=1 Tax=Chitinophaga niastensis TaxID=536980 RepID=A0A2P8HTF4_CHINA|nr:SRPBCC family protein [Chitinophaga niastensis]PSL49507.1 polyketide cyclase/dehydrase/lipid transport protein [Chitinophaga niastensis]